MSPRWIIIANNRWRSNYFLKLTIISPIGQEASLHGIGLDPFLIPSSIHGQISPHFVLGRFLNSSPIMHPALRQVNGLHGQISFSLQYAIFIQLLFCHKKTSLVGGSFSAFNFKLRGKSSLWRGNKADKHDQVKIHIYKIILTSGFYFVNN